MTLIEFIAHLLLIAWPATGPTDGRILPEDYIQLMRDINNAVKLEVVVNQPGKWNIDHLDDRIQLCRLPGSEYFFEVRDTGDPGEFSHEDDIADLSKAGECTVPLD